MREQERGKRLIAIFLLGVILFNPPLLTAAEGGGLIFGLPPLILYLFGAWSVLIALLCAVIEGGKQR